LDFKTRTFLQFVQKEDLSSDKCDAIIVEDEIIHECLCKPKSECRKIVGIVSECLSCWQFVFERMQLAKFKDTCLVCAVVHVAQILTNN